MIVLALNTAMDGCDVALLVDGHVAADVSTPMAKGHDSSLPVLVSEVMKRADRRLVEVDRIAVVTGPGSFTGVRVGVAFARGLALALSRPAVGVSSLAAMPREPGRVLAMLPAKTRPPDLTWWAQEFVDDKPAGDPFEEGLDLLIDRMQHVSGVVGGLGGALLSRLPDGIWMRDERPTALEAAKVVSFMSSIDRLPPATPVYVRPPDATVMLKV